MLEGLAEIGDLVTYIGTSDYPKNKTRPPILKYFKIGGRYIIREVGVFESGCNYYKLRGYVCAYPCECFRKSGRQVMSLLYGLR